ncbi:hypothetical protein ACH4OV_28910 [Streptomyces diastaticus]|uniref:hypothetical protein n=1 Tax=Streptomyces diastaticus TaxID=1956 RepID=UPI0037A28F8C
MVEEALRAEAQVLQDMISTHDSADFMRRLRERIAAKDTVPDTEGHRAPPRASGSATAGRQQHRSVRPVAPKGRQRRRTPPITLAEPAIQPETVLNYLRRVCNTLLDEATAPTLMRAFVSDFAPDGARVFGCFLYAQQLQPNALYWWRFAAGAGDPLSAHLLAVHHAASGSHCDARVWRAYARYLNYSASDHLPNPVHLALRSEPSFVPPRSDEAVQAFVHEPDLAQALLTR